MGRFKKLGMALSAIALLSSCGGGKSNSNKTTSPPVAAPPPTPPPPPTGGCSLGERQAWAAAQLNEWYLFPELLATNVNPASFTTVQDYVDALVAPARAQNKDRFFTHVASLAQHNAFFSSGSTAGLGMRLASDTAARRVFISEAFENGPALAAGMDRGTEILAIGTSTADLRTADSIIADEGTAGINAALGPNTAGTTRLLRVRDTNGTIRDVTVTKAEFTLSAVSSRYGVRIIDDGGKKVGYVNLRTFIDSADPQLRSAFAQLRAEGITEVIVDLRYNAGGQIAIADLIANLLLGQRSPSDVLQHRVHRASKSNFNSTKFFAPQPQSIASTKVAFIATGSAGSSSEIVMNSVIPYLGGKTALIGSNTYGKPVGTRYLDRAACDDRLVAVAFVTQNTEKQGDFFNGIASKFQTTCSAADDLTRQFGDPQENMVKIALDFLAGRQCASPIGGGGTTAQAAGGGITAPGLGKAFTYQLITPNAPDTVQREVPGFF